MHFLTSSGLGLELDIRAIAAISNPFCSVTASTAAALIDLGPVRPACRVWWNKSKEGNPTLSISQSLLGRKDVRNAGHEPQSRSAEILNGPVEVRL